MLNSNHKYKAYKKPSGTHTSKTKMIHSPDTKLEKIQNKYPPIYQHHIISHDHTHFHFVFDEYPKRIMIYFRFSLLPIFHLQISFTKKCTPTLHGTCPPCTFTHCFPLLPFITFHWNMAISFPPHVISCELSAKNSTPTTNSA